MAGSQDLPPYQHALALTEAGFILLGNGDPVRAQQLFERTLPLYRQDNDRPAVPVTMHALVLVVLGHLAARRRDYADAGRLVDASRALLRELRDDDLTGFDRLQQQVALGTVDRVLGLVRLSQGDNDAAARLFTDGLAVARRAQDWNPLLISLYDLALARQAQGDPAAAAGHLRGGAGAGGPGRRRNQRRLLPRGPGGHRRSAGQPAAGRPPVRRRPLDPGRPRQRLAARLRAPRPARRRGPGRPALPHRRYGIRAGAGVGPVRREHTRGGIRTPAGVTRRDRVRPRQAAAGPAPGVTPRRGAGGRAGRSQGAQAAGPARPDLSQAREAAQRQTRQDATRDQAELRGTGKAEIAAAGDARAGRQARAKQAEAELERTRAEHDQAAGGPPGITPRPATPPPALAGKLSDQHLLAQKIRSGVGVAWRLAASRRAHSALSAATSCCCHVEFRAGKRWCACQRGCALLPGSWAGEGIEYGGAVSSADPREYPCVCRSRALAGAVWPRPRRNGPGRRAWPWSQALLIARASSRACSGLPGRAGLVIPQPPHGWGAGLPAGSRGWRDPVAKIYASARR